VAYAREVEGDSISTPSELAVVVDTAGSGVEVGEDWTLVAVGTTLEDAEFMACPRG
jgi:hypothetical protein